MIYSTHTFELTLIIDTKKFCKLKDKAYEKAKGNYRVFYDEYDICHDEAFKDEGVKIEYHKNKYKKKVKLIINPTELLGGDDVKKLWKPNNENISKLFRKLKGYIDSYFDSKYKLNDFKLTRMDFTVNINVGNPNNLVILKKISNFSRRFTENSIALFES